MWGLAGIDASVGYSAQRSSLEADDRCNEASWDAAYERLALLKSALDLDEVVIFGKLDKEDLKSILDLSPREIAIFAPLIVVTIWMGVWPAPFLDVMDASIANLIEQHKVAMNALQSVSLAGK